MTQLASVGFQAAVELPMHPGACLCNVGPLRAGGQGCAWAAAFAHPCLHAGLQQAASLAQTWLNNNWLAWQQTGTMVEKVRVKHSASLVGSCSRLCMHAEPAAYLVPVRC